MVSYRLAEVTKATMFKTFEAHPRLQDFILFYFELNWQKKHPNETIKHLSLPTGCSFMGFQSIGTMQVQIEDSTYPTETYFVNAQTTFPYYMRYAGDHLKAIVACLKPTTLHHLFKIDVSRIVNTGVNPTTLFKGKLDNAFQTHLTSNTTPQNIQALDTLFIQQLDTAQPRFNFIDAAIDTIITSKGELKLHELVDTLGVSKRYFQKKFKEMVGISPSTYQHIIRYNFIFSSLTAKEPSYKATDASFYFYDSAHYSKDFKKFWGMSPSEFNPDQHPFLKLTAIEKAAWISSFKSLTTA